MNTRGGTLAPVIDAELAAELEEHKGRWVAVHDGRLCGVGDSAREVLTAADAVGVSDPLVFRVRAHPERLAFFSSSSLQREVRRQIDVQQLSRIPELHDKALKEVISTQ